jgi:hypothetical protein
MDSSAPAMSHALEELVGHVERLQRSLLFTHFRLEQGADQLSISPIRATPSRDKTDVFMLKDAILLSLSRASKVAPRAGRHRPVVTRLP